MTKQDTQPTANRGSEDDFGLIRSFLRDRYGLYFPENRRYNLRHKIARRVDDLECEDLSAYREYLFDKPRREAPKLVEEVSTNKSYFYREPEHWEFLRDRIIPEFCSRDRFLNVWSPACSTGEEPYTAAMVMEEHCPVTERDDSLRYRVLGTDVSGEVLRQAVRGVYRSSDLRYLRERRPRWVDRYFDEREDGRWGLDDEVRRRVVFRQFNLRSSRYPLKDTFQLVICRNVLIYLDESTVEQVLNQLVESLVPGGYLFVGHTESITDRVNGLERITSSIFRLSETT